MAAHVLRRLTIIVVETRRILHSHDVAAAQPQHSNDGEPEHFCPPSLHFSLDISSFSTLVLLVKRPSPVS